MHGYSPGDRIGRYHLLGLLGSGAMGEVWAAELEGPSGFVKPVALKVLKAGPASTTERSALLQEAKLGALLHHPNVVSVHGLEEEGQGWVVAMELVRGVTVQQLLRAGPLPVRAVVELGMQAAAGLFHIHQLRVDGQPAALVHRDIKPANLLVDSHGIVKVADLGVAAAAGTGPAVGTPRYMAPEQWDGRAEARSDLFSLGVTLFLCTTGQRPFKNARDPVVLQQPELVSAVTAVSGELGAVIGRCLRARPEHRFDTALALRQALAAVFVEGPGLLDVLAHARPDLGVPGTDSVPSVSTGRTLVLTRGNLASIRGAFFGRAGEVDDLVTRLQGPDRLVTLLGPGGMGKTRLALEAGARLQRDLAGGAWFLDCTEARSVAGICAVVARVLGLRPDRADPVSQIGHAVAARGGALFVFDNLEQCVEHLPATLGVWATAAPDGRFLCTSRIAPGLRGERLVDLGPLADDDAVELFCDRAPVAIPDAHLADVRTLVRKVDGMPLAVELAAARARLMPVPRLLARMGPRLLAGGSSHLPERHRSIEASLQWSWDLLSEVGRTAMAQLSVCEGGFDLSTAEAILRLPRDLWALDVLQELVDSSLIRVQPDRSRFSMLAVVEAFCSTRLEDGPAVRRRHGEWFAQQRSDAQPEDVDNLVAACRWAHQAGEPELAAGCALGAWKTLGRSGPLLLGLELLEASRDCSGPTRERVVLAYIGALADAGRVEHAMAIAGVELEAAVAADAPGLEARLRGKLGVVLDFQGRLHESIEELERALVILERAPDPLTEAIVSNSLGNLRMRLGRLQEARAPLERALQITQRIGNGQIEASVRSNLGAVLCLSGLDEPAMEQMADALQLRRAHKDPFGEAMTLVSIGNVHLEAKRLDEARSAFEAALGLHRHAGSRRMEALLMCNLGGLHQRLGNHEDARAYLESALPVQIEIGNRGYQAHTLANLATVWVELGQPERALRDRSSASRLFDELEDPAKSGEQHRLRSELLQELGRPEEARVALEEARARLEGP